MRGKGKRYLRTAGAAVLAMSLAAGGCSGRGGARGAGNASAEAVAAASYVDRELSDAADAVTRDLAALTGSRSSLQAPGGLRSRLHAPGTLAYDGPIEDALSRACAESGMRLAVYGKRPDVPVVVHVRMSNRPWLEVFRAIGMQTGPGVKVRLVEAARTVELRYGSGA